jgi:hypothetical protein
MPDVVTPQSLANQVVFISPLMSSASVLMSANSQVER